MSRLTKQEWQDLRKNFRRSEGLREDYPYECCSCDKPIRTFKQWWQKTSVEYDEWDCYCARCALYQIHLYDDFDMEEYDRIARENSSVSLSMEDLGITVREYDALGNG